MGLGINPQENECKMGVHSIWLKYFGRLFNVHETGKSGEGDGNADTMSVFDGSLTILFQNDLEPKPRWIDSALKWP